VRHFLPSSSLEGANNNLYKEKEGKSENAFIPSDKHENRLRNGAFSPFSLIF